MPDLAVLTQSDLFGGGGEAQVQAFLAAALDLEREPRRFAPCFVPALDSVNQLVAARRLARELRPAAALWVVAPTAAYGYAAVRSGRPYACWIAAGLEDEWRARSGLPLSRRLALRANAPLLLHIERAVLRGAQRVFTISPASRRALATAANVSEDRISILPLPVDLERFAPEPGERWRATLGQPVLAFVGRGDDPRKNVELLLAAFALVREGFPEAGLRLIGTPPRQDPGAGVDVLGEVDSVADALGGSSILVLPSLQEGFGIVVAEAMAKGLPVVVTPCGGPEELVRSSGGGVVLGDFAASTLAQAVVDLLARPCRLEEMRTAGRAYVEHEHSPARLREGLRAAFAELEPGG